MAIFHPSTQLTYLPCTLQLTSFGAGCGDKSFPGVYTRVSSFKSYICSQTGSEPYDCPGGTDTGGGATLATPSSAASRIPNVLSLLLGSK